MAGKIGKILPQIDSTSNIPEWVEFLNNENIEKIWNTIIKLARLDADYYSLQKIKEWKLSSTKLQKIIHFLEQIEQEFKNDPIEEKGINRILIELFKKQIANITSEGWKLWTVENIVKRKDIFIDYLSKDFLYDFKKRILNILESWRIKFEHTKQSNLEKINSKGEHIRINWNWDEIFFANIKIEEKAKPKKLLKFQNGEILEIKQEIKIKDETVLVLIRKDKQFVYNFSTWKEDYKFDTFSDIIPKWENNVNLAQKYNQFDTIRFEMDNDKILIIAWFTWLWELFIDVNNHELMFNWFLSQIWRDSHIIPENKEKWILNERKLKYIRLKDQEWYIDMNTKELMWWNLFKNIWSIEEFDWVYHFMTNLRIEMVHYAVDWFVNINMNTFFECKSCYDVRPFTFQWKNKVFMYRKKINNDDNEMIFWYGFMLLNWELLYWKHFKNIIEKRYKNDYSKKPWISFSEFEWNNFLIDIENGVKIWEWTEVIDYIHSDREWFVIKFRKWHKRTKKISYEEAEKIIKKELEKQESNKIFALPYNALINIQNSK